MTTNTTSRLARLKAAYGQPEDRQPREFASNTKMFPFWNMKVGQRAVVRFIADKNPDNILGFMVEKLTHVLTVNGEKKTVPCRSMYGEACPICELSQKFYKAKDDVNGKKYYKKRQYLAQVLVVEDPLPADQQTGQTNVGQVRTLAINYQIRNLINEAFANVDEPLEHDPDDIENGYDFVIKKTEQGGYASYVVGTKFMSRPRALTETEIVAVTEGAVDLSTLLPRDIGAEKVQAMLDADVSGDAFDNNDSTPPTRVSAAAPATSPAAPAAAPAIPAGDVEDDEDMNQMLAMIRQRRGG